MAWRVQPRRAEKFLLLGDDSGVAYRRIERLRSSTRARRTPVRPQTPVGAGDTASGELLDWFRLFGDEQGVRTNQLTGWKLLSTPGESVVHLFDPAGEVYDIDVGEIPRDGSFKPLRPRTGGGCPSRSAGTAEGCIVAPAATGRTAIRFAEEAPDRGVKSRLQLESALVWARMAGEDGIDRATLAKVL